MTAVNDSSSGVVVQVDPEELRELWKQMKFAVARRTPELSDDYLMGFSHALRVNGHITADEFYQVSEFVHARMLHALGVSFGPVR
jgi:hypothetical protein